MVGYGQQRWSTGCQREAAGPEQASVVDAMVRRSATNDSTARISEDRSAGLRKYIDQHRGPTVGSGAADIRTIGTWVNAGQHRTRLQSSAPSISGLSRSVMMTFAGS